MFAVAGTLLSTGALAQTDVTDLTALPIEQLMQVQVVTSASKYAQAANEAPANVSVVTAADIKAYGWRTLADILGSLPGLYTNYDRSYHTLGARGILRAGDYDTRFLLLIDGHPRTLSGTALRHYSLIPVLTHCAGGGTARVASPAALRAPPSRG